LGRRYSRPDRRRNRPIEVEWAETMADENAILAAIAKNHAEVMDCIGGVIGLIDGLAKSTDLSLGRIEGDVARIEGGTNALRADIHAFRMEMRASLKRHDERIAALEARP
jgi:hypothetical protein